MQRFWSWLAVGLGKRAVPVVLIGLAITVGLGLGISKLKFATGQDSYLNKSDQVFKDNVEYQNLFGGQAVLSVITMDEGHKIDELFTAEGRQKFSDLHDTLTESGKFQGIITPLTILQFSDNLVNSPDGDITKSIAGKALLGALAKEEPGSPGADARSKDAAATLTRLAAIPVETRNFDNPEWVKFLLYDNEGNVRKALE